MLVLVINAGSSSLKYQLFDMDTSEVIAKGLCERIGIEGGRFKHTSSKCEIGVDAHMNSHADAITLVTRYLTDPKVGVIRSMSEIGAVGHRVLHAGEKYSASVLIDDSVIAAVEECVPLGPLHNPANLIGILACKEVMGDVAQVAVFDTAFHQTMPEKAFIYAIPYRYYEKYRIRRYGFHGTSHRYVSARAAKLLGRQGDPNLKIITCHLGNGSSVAAVSGGKCVDTSMGLTPLEGVPMGTRSGSIDPAIIGFISERELSSASDIVTMLNKESGMLGISEHSSDFRDLDAAVDKGNKKAQLALDIFTYSVKKTIGAYAAAMGGLDAVVFTAGVGENNKRVRKACVEGLDFMGICLDETKNNSAEKEKFISRDDSKVKIMVVPTDEELVIAMDTAQIVGK